MAPTQFGKKLNHLRASSPEANSFATKNGLFDSQAILRDLSPIERHKLVLNGFTKSELKSTLQWFKQVPYAELMKAIGFHDSSEQSTNHHRLSPTQSGALLAMVEICSDAEQAFGNQELVEDWLVVPALALDGLRPVDLFTTHPGQEALQKLVARIKYSIYQ